MCDERAFRIVGDDDLIPNLSEKVGGAVDGCIRKGKDSIRTYETLAFSEDLMRAAVDVGGRLHNTCYAGIMKHDSMWKRQIAQ